ncbi:uncharacterized protein CIMG_05831 [Coccidioides immitis RS]|uniref:Subtilisin-like serine protease n=2 Tax=Coccidioides immitis TaxID=5501 RepID=J3K6V6_COCIM|nr:uncharacterized protein CIMG_05831 [Coccidioides immitis RS]EAS30352.3 hypothetical protein CIMG_05831 [Coccidioides immitis RS]KMP02901.1 hypothetical protein CIRG_02593 [Coccidioides immitis RMSCC 2394]TPX23341.1 hypothetical protein DIZ76_012670 [Coccidioides immitis]
MEALSQPTGSVKSVVVEEPPLKPPFSREAVPSDLAVLSEVMSSLPTISRTRLHDAFLTETDVASYLQRDLDLSRLNRIHNILWMAGRPINARPLHRQRMMGLEIIPTEQSDLHLLKFSNHLLVKPLPSYLLNHDFWTKHLCSSKELHESASGLLVSYIWLICSPIDLKVAQDHQLLPSNLAWTWWKSFVDDVFKHININALDTVNKRYHFGELRLNRINSIYRVRFFFTHFIRGYLYGYNRYTVFFERNFGWILVVFVYFSLVLSAMQVAMDVPGLQDNTDFVNATYGFVIFSIVIVAFFLGLVALIFTSIFLYNMGAAISDDREKRLRREKLSRERII